jgi:hypothetical protein
METRKRIHKCPPPVPILSQSIRAGPRLSVWTFRNKASRLISLLTYLPRKMEQTECSETSAYKIRRRGITQKKTYNILNKAKVWNQEFRNKLRFYGEVLLAPHTTSQAGGPPLVCCPRLLIQYICSYPPYWRTFLHPQPEDAPCRGDRKLLITGKKPRPTNVPSKVLHRQCLLILLGMWNFKTT